MQDNQFIDDLVNISHSPEAIEKFKTYNIKTYSAMFEALSNPKQELNIRINACQAIFVLWSSIDRRRAVPVLLKAIKSPEQELRHNIVRTLGQLRARQSVKALMAITQNQAEDIQVRYLAVEALGMIQDERAKPMLQRLVLDVSDSPYIRSAAIEWAYLLLFDKDDLSIFDKLLADPSPDIRFWSTFALANLGGHGYDITSMLSKLDHIAVFDHSVPEFWGWHVSREALAALERIYFQTYCQHYIDEHGYPNEHSWGVWLISPMPEYARYLRLYRKWSDDWRYTIEMQPAVSLEISPEWLKEQLQAAWQQVSFDVRIDSGAYTLSWLIQIEGYNLLGGLHRDGYAIVLTGHSEAVRQFALWYCHIIANDSIHLYEWASPGIKLHHSMTLQDVSNALNSQYTSSS